MEDESDWQNQEYDQEDDNYGWRDDDSWSYEAKEQTAEERMNEALARRAKRMTLIPPVRADDLVESELPDKDKDFTKSQEDAIMLGKQLQTVILFGSYHLDEMSTFTDYMYSIKVKSGDRILKQGEFGDALYVIKSGKFRCDIEENGQLVKSFEYQGNGVFGELALINNARRAASITATTDGEIFALNTSRYHFMKKKFTNDKCYETTNIIKQIPSLKNVDCATISTLVDALEAVRLEPGEIVCKQGEPADGMYFVVEGVINIEIDGKIVERLEKGKCFGERALVTKEKRAATCRAETKTRLAKLTKDLFDRHMPAHVVDDMKEYCRKVYNNTIMANKSVKAAVQAQNQRRNKLAAGSTPVNRMKSINKKLEDQTNATGVELVVD